MAVLLLVGGSLAQRREQPDARRRRRGADYGGEEGGEVAHRPRDLRRMRSQGEGAGVKEADDRTGHAALERLGTRRQEKRIVLAPGRQEGRSVRTEVILEGRVQSDVALVVAEQVQ